MTYFKPNDMYKVFYKAFRKLNTRNYKKITYINIPCSFDIETSSFINGKDKTAITYIWMLGLNGRVIIGRTWEEFLIVYGKLCEYLELSENYRLILYIHNLSYEFQFFRKYFDWKKVFALDSRKPVYALTVDGVEFRCSYILSGYSLSKLGDNLTKYRVLKMSGDLDYKKVRHSKTPINYKEKKYCINDARVVMAYIKERIDIDGGIDRIPLTKTGYVRRYCRDICFFGDDKKRNKWSRLKYRETIKALTLEAEEYKRCVRAFQGGFTHANPFYSGKILNNVTSFDFTSSYPTVMVAEQFPMSSGRVVEVHGKEDFKKYIMGFCCVFDIRFFGLRPKIFIDNYISLSRCRNVEKAAINNGRVVSADRLETTITNEDFLIIQRFYSWDSMQVSNFTIYKKGYLPTNFVKSILKLYADKTRLKGIVGKEFEYLSAKENVNSLYGMAVTNICRDEYIYSDRWEEPKTPDLAKTLNRYNKDSNRFIYYPWGIFVTAYARRNLIFGLLEFKGDYIYSDTDSVKVLNAERHIEFITKYNEWITNRLKKALDYHGIPHEAIKPKNNKGVEKPLGVWCFDGDYEIFKTLGAKRYMVKYSNDKRNDPGEVGKISLTVSGLNKKITVPYMLEKYGTDIFNAFEDGLYIPPEYTGKNTHTYIDDTRSGVVVDYLGTPCEYREASGIYLEAAPYDLGLSQEYINYIVSLRNNENFPSKRKKEV